MYKKYKKALIYLGFILFFLVSGGLYFYILHGNVFVPLFLFVSTILHLLIKRQINDLFTSAFFYISFIYIIIHYLLVPEHVGNTFLPQLLLFVGAYIFISTFNIIQFKKYYLTTITYIAIISIIVFFAVNIGIVGYHAYEGTKVFAFYHCVGNGGLWNRLSGVYWEPGAYQIPLNLTYLLYFQEILDNKIQRKDRIKFIIVTIALLMTQSTAGFMMLGIFLCAYIYESIRQSKISIKKLGLFFIIIVSIVGIYNSDTIQNKLNRKTDADSSSYSIRMMDNIAMIKMIQNRPLFGYGQDSKEGRIISAQLGNLTNSNGILAMSVGLGCVYLLIYLMFLHKGLCKVYNNRLSFLILLLFIFLQSFEVYWYFPLSYTFHFINTTKNAYNQT